MFSLGLLLCWGPHLTSLVSIWMWTLQEGQSLVQQLGLAKASVVKCTVFKQRPEEKCYPRPVYGIARMPRNDISVLFHVYLEGTHGFHVELDWQSWISYLFDCLYNLRNILAFSQVVFFKGSCVSLLNAMMAPDDSSIVRLARWMILKSHLYKRQG